MSLGQIASGASQAGHVFFRYPRGNQGTGKYLVIHKIECDIGPVRYVVASPNDDGVLFVKASKRGLDLARGNDANEAGGSVVAFLRASTD